MRFNFFGFGSATDETLPDIFPIPIEQGVFVKIDVENIFTRILTDVLERTQGITDKLKPLLWDNCLASEKQDGMVTLIAKAMVDKSDLFLVYFPATSIVRKATPAEEQLIRDSYKLIAEPVKIDGGGTGIYVTFKNYLKSDMVKFYSALEYCAVGGLWKQANVSKAIQLKLKELRSSVSISDSEIAKNQAKKMAEGLKNGKDILMDAEDVVESLKMDLTATDSALALIAKKQSFYLGMPASYLTGELVGSMSDTGKADSKAVERGLKAYYFSVVKPTIEGLFSIKTTFKSEDTEGLDTALKTLETFDRTSDDHLSKENKTLIVNKAFGLDESETGDEPEKVVTDPALDQKTAVPGKTPPAQAG